MPHVDYNAPKSQFEKITDYLSIALLVFLFVYTAINFLAMPDTVPTHFNIKGDIDGWGSRGFVWFMPFISVFTFIILLLPDRFPRAMNYPVKITKNNAQRQFLLARMFLKTLKLAIILMFLVLQVVLVNMALQVGVGVNMAVLIPLLLVIVVLPIVLYMVLAIKAQ